MNKAVYLTFTYDKKVVRASLPLGKYWPDSFLAFGAARLPLRPHQSALGLANWWLSWPLPEKKTRISLLATLLAKAEIQETAALGASPQATQALGGPVACRQGLAELGKVFLAGEAMVLPWVGEMVCRYSPHHIFLRLPEKGKAAQPLPLGLLSWLCCRTGRLTIAGSVSPALERWQEQETYQTGTTIQCLPLSKWMKPGWAAAQDDLCRTSWLALDLIEGRISGQPLCNQRDSQTGNGRQQIINPVAVWPWSEATFVCRGEGRLLSGIQAEVLLYRRAFPLWQQLRNWALIQDRKEVENALAAFLRAGFTLRYFS